jgi:hypothetical protein
MKTPYRLDSISPRLADLFRVACDEQRRQAVLAACLAAIESVGLHGFEIDTAIEFIRHGCGSLENVKHNLEVLSLNFDEQYLQLNDKAGKVTPEAYLLFRQSRVLAALAFALSPDSGQLHEAIYEAIIAAGNRAAVLNSTERVFMASSK